MKKQAYLYSPLASFFGVSGTSGSRCWCTKNGRTRCVGGLLLVCLVLECEKAHGLLLSTSEQWTSSMRTNEWFTCTWIIMFDYMWFFAILCIISQKGIHCYKGFYRNRAVMYGWTRHRSQKHCRNFLHNIAPIMFIFLDGRLTFEKLITDPAVSNSNGSMFLLL